MSLLLNMLSRLVITLLPRSKRLLISWMQSPSAVILEPPKVKSVTVSTVSPSISHEVMGPDAMSGRWLCAKLGCFVIHTSLSSRPSLLPQRPGVKEREWYPSLMSKGHRFQQVHLSANGRWFWHLEILSWDRNHDMCWFPLELSCAMLVISLYLILSVGQICLQMQTGRCLSLKNK